MLTRDALGIETKLAKLVGEEPAAVRDYLYQVLEERLWRGPKLTERRTGIRFVRGTHGGTFIRDAAGNDVLPPGVEPPRAESASRSRGKRTVTGG